LRLRGTEALGPARDVVLDLIYELDGASNVKRITDRRPEGRVPFGDLRRNSQAFDYDDAHRLLAVRYSFVPSITQDAGGVNYRYDAIGNLIRQTSSLVGRGGARSEVDLGSLNYGTKNRYPHRVTSTQSGQVLKYDECGNTTLLDGASLEWDPWGRL